MKIEARTMLWTVDGDCSAENFVNLLPLCWQFDEAHGTFAQFREPFLITTAPDLRDMTMIELEEGSKVGLWGAVLTTGGWRAVDELEPRDRLVGVAYDVRQASASTRTSYRLSDIRATAVVTRISRQAGKWYTLRTDAILTVGGLLCRS